MFPRQGQSKSENSGLLAMINKNRCISVPFGIFFVILCIVYFTGPDASADASILNAGGRDLQTTTGSRQFTVLIDAGSSGSRIHVFPYEMESAAHLPLLHASEQLKLRPGLSSFEDNPSAAGASIAGLLDFAKGIVPESQWSVTPVHLEATAGLRMIDAAAAEAILVSCRATINASPFKFSNGNARIISGTEEGVFGWLATNYLRGAFDPVRAEQEAVHTVGVIEMGGASMQMTFKPHDKKITPKLLDGVDDPLEIVLLTINGQHFTIYTHSYLNYGLEAAQRLFQSSNMDEIEDEGNPCYPQHFRHSSTGSYAQCTELIGNLFEFSEESCGYPDATCGFNRVYQPHITTEKFVAIENFFYTTSFYGVENQREFVRHLESTGKDFCETSWYWERKYPEESGDSLSKYCFSSAYIPTVLLHAFGFNAQQLEDNVQVLRAVGDTPIDWAIGSAFAAIVGVKMTTTAEQSISQAFASPNLDEEETLEETPSSFSETLVWFGVIAGAVYVAWFFRKQIAEKISGPERPTGIRGVNVV